jgi:hypothetical protein
MATPQKRVRRMSDISARLSPEPLRFIWQRHTRKRIAQRFRVTVHTARDWLRDGVPRERRRQMANIITAELDEIEAAIQRIRESGER